MEDITPTLTDVAQQQEAIEVNSSPELLNKEDSSSQSEAEEEITRDRSITSSLPNNNSMEALFKKFLETINNTASDTVKGVDVRKPDKFSGDDRERSQLRTFLAQNNLVFMASPRKYKHGSQRVTYAASYLSGDAFKWFETYLDRKPKPTWFSDWEAFCEQLRLNFGDPNAQVTAEYKISQLKMKDNDVVNTYITKFHTWSHMLEWNDSALCAAFRCGLCSRLKDEIARSTYRYNADGKGNELLQLETICIELDGRYWERQREKRTESNHSTNSEVREATR